MPVGICFLDRRMTLTVSAAVCWKPLTVFGMARPRSAATLTLIPFQCSDSAVYDIDHMLGRMVHIRSLSPSPAFLQYMYPSFASLLSQSSAFPPHTPPAGSRLNTFLAGQNPPAIRRPAMSKSFYMRELPKEHLIGYDTVEGKRLFKQALLEGGLESFFPLSQQFLTVSSPEYQLLIDGLGLINFPSV